MQSIGLYLLLQGFMSKVRYLVIGLFVTGIILVCCWPSTPRASGAALPRLGSVRAHATWMERMSGDIQDLRDFFTAKAEELRDVTKDNLQAVFELFKNAPADPKDPLLGDISQVEIQDFETTSKRLQSRRDLESTVAKLLSNSQ